MPRHSVTAAIERLRTASSWSVDAVSRLWETAPVPISDQPWYVNAVVAAKTTLGVGEILNSLHDIENDFGRTRNRRWEARILDLDLLAHGPLVCGRDQLREPVVPHPRLAERAFVLLPLAEVAPGWRHPATGETVEAMIARLDPGQICRPLEA
ncbi:2-amino-4-hydroxy-6-hydroxymethyldihydropteridine diphosphokinase [Zavarzinia compransoris]|nr:2-amino-4-hydroxy-6-hydroxymethyldihydropteridine diphosphokinase [Zavarzinia compransoris]